MSLDSQKLDRRPSSAYRAGHRWGEIEPLGEPGDKARRQVGNFFVLLVLGALAAWGIQNKQKEHARVDDYSFIAIEKTDE